MQIIYINATTSTMYRYEKSGISVNIYIQQKKNNLKYEHLFETFFFFAFRKALEALSIKQKMEFISIIRLSIDLMHSVSTLPSGWFWGGKLKTWHVGALGTLSATIGIYQYFAKKNLKK